MWNLCWDWPWMSEWCNLCQHTGRIYVSFHRAFQYIVLHANLHDSDTCVRNKYFEATSPFFHYYVIKPFKRVYILSVITKLFFPTKFNIIIYKYQQTVSSIHLYKFVSEIVMILSLDKHNLLFIHYASQ
jgi:hypothetical protein